ncbi:MAG: hypothetical protein KBA33_08905 [Cloacibacterium sp.]|nr:hypothetical protein [Cloacibacterium sp.]
MRKKIYFFSLAWLHLALLFFSSSKVFAQTLPNFTLTVTPTAETCTGNGKLTFSTSGTMSGSTITYYVYKAPDYTTPVATTVANSVTGLTSGTYRVVAVQSMTGYPNNSQTWNGSIANSKTTLAYTTAKTDEICGNDGTITITKTTGTLDATTPYTLYNATGTTVIAGPQASNVFTGLIAGTYLVAVKDSCGQVTTKSITITKLTPNVNFVLTSTIDGEATCDKLTAVIGINSGSTTSVVNYPIIVTMTTYNASGSQIESYSEIKTGSDFISNSTTRQYTFPIPYLPGQAYTYKVSVKDDCGNIFEKTASVNVSPLISFRKNNACGGSFIDLGSAGFNSPITYTVTGSGTAASYGTQTFLNLLNQPYNHDLTVGSFSSPLINGTYTVTATDQCGHTATTVIALENTTPTITTRLTSPGCQVGTINIGINAPSGMAFASAKLTAYPAAYTGPTTATINSTNPFATFNIPPNNQWVAMNGVPTGTYTFEITDTCGNIYTETITNNTGLTHGTLGITQKINCNSFDLSLNITGSNSFNDIYYLQFYNTTTNTWQNVATLANGTLNGSYTAEGQYRVIKAYQTRGVCISINSYWYNDHDCQDVLKTFTYSRNQLNLDVVYEFTCSDGVHHNLYASAKLGVEPYTFQIIEKSGDPSFIPQNPTSSSSADAFFTGLVSGIYKLRVTDACLNTKDIWVDMSILPPPTITATNICNGSNGSLSVQNNPYLSYSWTKDSNPTVLSTSSVLNFTPFNATTDAGTYYLHITSNVSGACVNEILSFTIGSNLTSPNAGPDVSKTVCNDVMSINLNNYLDSTADVNGTWSEITSTPSGYLNGSMWSPFLSGTGTFIFQYTANGLCSGQDTAIYTVTVNDCGVCYINPNTSVAGIDSKHGITLLQRAGSDNGNWPMIRKSAHTVLESNTKGFVVTRMTSDPAQTLAANYIDKITNPVEGMLIYDTYAKCLKIYDGSQWRCFATPACP